MAGLSCPFGRLLTSWSGNPKLLLQQGKWLYVRVRSSALLMCLSGGLQSNCKYVGLLRTCIARACSVASSQVEPIPRVEQNLVFFLSTSELSVAWIDRPHDLPQGSYGYSGACCKPFARFSDPSDHVHSRQNHSGLAFSYLLMQRDLIELRSHHCLSNMPAIFASRASPRHK